MEIYCPIHDEHHEVYQGYRECVFVNEKVSYLSLREDEEPVHIISTGKVMELIDGELLGLEREKV